MSEAGAEEVVGKAHEVEEEKEKKQQEDALQDGEILQGGVNKECQAMEDTSALTSTKQSNDEDSAEM